MFRSFPFNTGRWAAVLAVFGALVLSGCATPTVSARVTSFQQWPAGVEGQTYQFVPAEPSQANNLEYQSYQDMVRAGIGATGLVEAQGGAKARFNVSFRYGTTQTQVMVRRPYDPYFNGGYGYGGFYGPRPWGGYYGYWGPEWVDVPVVAQRVFLPSIPPVTAPLPITPPTTKVRKRIMAGSRRASARLTARATSLSYTSVFRIR